MTIRKAAEKDFVIISQCDKHILPDELKHLIQTERVYIATEEDIMIGWLRYNLFWDNTPFMNMLYILENHRGIGNGKALVSYWEDEMKKAGFEAVMTSSASDEYAQHFYTALGYKAIGSFIPHGDPLEIVFEKVIK